MTDIESKQLGARILLWSILFSTSSFLLFGFTEMATGEKSKVLMNTLEYILIPTFVILYGYFVYKKGDRAEYLVFGRLLSDNKLKKE